MGTIRAIHLEQWAGTVDARNLLGKLIRRLIHAGLLLQDIAQIQFYANEANQLSGWDGILSCRSNIPWIPDGQSVWELGAGLSDRQKVRSDYKNRLDYNLPENWLQKDTTYIAVSLKKFDNRSGFVTELKQENPWRDVRIVDAAVLEEWIEQYLGVETWLQENGVGPVSNIKSLYRCWKDWSETTEPVISADLVLTELEKEAASLRSRINEDGCFMRIKSDSPSTSLAFSYAAIVQSEGSISENVLSKSIVISDPDATNRLLTMNPHNVFLRNHAVEKARILAREGHKVVCAFGNSSLNQNTDIVIKRPLRSNFVEKLIDMGVERRKAEVEARACGASIAIWRIWNQLEFGDPEHCLPAWAGHEYAELVVPAIFLGGWSERFEGDKEIVKLFTGLEYETFRDRIRPLLAYDEPFITKVDDAWVVSAPATAFAVIINNITTGQLEKLEEIFPKVFQEIDPTLDLAPDERPYAALKNATMRHSTWLRDGLAESLLRIVVLGKKLQEEGIIPGGLSRQNFADKNIKNLLGLSGDWRLLTSLRDQLPVLAEASPVPFMEALDRLLQGNPDDAKMIFEEGGDLSGHSFHSNFLWALETLAWEPLYLSRVSLLLAKLASIDPGGKLSNRPIASLREIFLAWHPGTSASLKQKTEVLDLILSREPEVAWSLIKKLLPSSHEMSHPTSEPRWKDFSRSTQKSTTRHDIWLAYQEYIKIALKVAGDNPKRWICLIDIYENVSEENQESIIDGLTWLSKKQINEEDKLLLWSKLRETINRHKKFPDATWSLPENSINRLESIQSYFLPVKLNDQVQWLFDEYLPDVGSPNEDYEEQQKYISILRIDAIKRICERTGSNEVLSLVRKVSYPGLIADSLMGAISSIDEFGELVIKSAEGNPAEKMFSSSLSTLALQKFGQKWTEHILPLMEQKKLDVNARVTPFLYYPDDRNTFELVENMGKEFTKEYWQAKPIGRFSDDQDTFIYALEKFMTFGRTLEMIPLIWSKRKNLEVRFGYSLLGNILKELNAGKSLNNISSGGYWIEKIFEWLREEYNIDRKKLARLEYAFLPIIVRKSSKKDLILHEMLSSDPIFLVDVLCDLYKPATQRSEDEEEKPTTEEKNRAHLAWELLQEWKLPPGIDDDGSLNSIVLERWVKTARNVAQKKDRADIADQEIGKVLFHVPKDPDDGVWPHKVLRDLLEQLASENIERGIELEQYNSRGVVTKDVFEGGKQERELSCQWKERADALSTRWPRVSGLCERIAGAWAAEAVREDERAEKDRLRFQ